MTTRGLGEAEMKTVAGWMKQIASLCVKARKEKPDETDDEALLADYADEFERIRAEVRDLALKFPLPATGC